MTSPVPGWVPPSPITWSSGEVVSAPRLRADMGGLANLYAQARPMLAGFDGTGDTVPSGGSGVVLDFSLQSLNSWNAQFLSLVAGPTPYHIPLPGYWLLQSFCVQTSPDTGSNQHRYTQGLKTVQNGGGANSFDGGSDSGDGVANHEFGLGNLDMLLFNSYAATADTAAVYAFTTDASGTTVASGYLIAEWIALPGQGSGLTNYTGPAGTVVNSPWAAALPGSGPGSTLVNSVSAGASSMQVNDPTGIVAGGTLGLDWYFGNPVKPIAEQVVVNTVSGNTVTTTTTFQFPHGQGAPVAVPISASWLNQQSRDLINFLGYPPIMRGQPSGAQSIASTGFPPTVGGNPTNQLTSMTPTTDNFGGFSSGTYTIPVSGVYLVYGQVAYAGSTTSNVVWGVGVSVSGGTIQWGTLTRTATVSAGAQVIIPTFRRHMRLTAGQTITLWAFQNSGAAVNTLTGGSSFTKFIAAWRSF
jgi:hypothetical protein